MSTATAPRLEVAPVTLPKVLRSEWIKFWSLRSSYWVIISTWLAMVFMSGLMGIAAISMSAADDAQAEIEVMGLDATLVLGVAYAMAQLAIAVLGVLIVSGEYSTGMIRSSLAAVPSRLPVLVAKAVVIAVVAFVTGVVGVAIAYLVTWPMLGNIGGPAPLTEPETLQVFWGTGLYFVGVALFSLAVGALLRHTAGAVATSLGVFFLLPIVVQMVGSWLDVVRDIGPYLPPTAGEQIIMGAAPDAAAGMGMGPEILGPWAGFGVLMAYVLVLFVAAAWLLRRRDA